MAACNNSDLAGISTETLQAWLLQAQTALHDLAIGGKPISVSYMQGDGQRTVIYTKADMGNIRAYIQELKSALGIGCGRRPIKPYFT